MSEKPPVLNIEPVAALTPTPDGIILSAQNITKVFPGTVALDDVSFSVRKGKVNVLIGENGAGKSCSMAGKSNCILPWMQLAWVSASFTRNSTCAPT